MVLQRFMGADEALAPDLWLLERDHFDTDKYIRSKCPAMSEKGVKKLRQELQDLKATFTEFSRTNVYGQYAHFIRATRDISGLETSLFEVRNLLSNHTALIHGLLQQPYIVEPDEVLDCSHIENGLLGSECARKFEYLLESLQVLLAERKTHKALDLLQDIELGFVQHASHKCSLNAYKSMLSLAKERLVEELVKGSMKASVRSVELCTTCRILQRLREGSKACNLLLTSHESRLSHNIRGLCRTGSSYGGAYTAALSQLVFSEISLAIKDSDAVFNGEQSCGSELVLWARNVIQDFVCLLRKYVLSSLAAAGGLRAAAECVHLALGHCFLLESQGLALCPLLSSLLKPPIEQAVSVNVARIGDRVVALAAADEWKLVQPLQIGRRASYQNADGTYVRLSFSAHTFNVLMEDFLHGVKPLTRFQLAHSVIEALSKVYGHYVDILMDALLPAGRISHLRNIKPAETMSKKLVILGNATGLATDILPAVSGTLSEMGLTRSNPEEQNEWKSYLQKSCERLRLKICGIFTEEILVSNDQVVTPCIYSEEEDLEWEQNPLPSATFRELVSKMDTLSKSGGEALRGQEQECQILMTYLLESVASKIFDNKCFWTRVEEGPETFGAVGLKKFVLDMQFIVQIATERDCISDVIYKVVADNIALATNAFALNGRDPMSVLPDDKWVIEASIAAYKTFAQV